MLFKEIISVYPENHMKATSTVYKQNVDLLIVKAGGKLHWNMWMKVGGCRMCRRKECAHVLTALSISIYLSLSPCMWNTLLTHLHL
jgi:hypothetical protein